MPASIGINLRVTGHCSQGGRKYMEDFFSVCYQQSEDEQDLEYAFFGIYDGHGGSEAAAFAKDHLMNSIVSQKLFWSDSDQDVLRAIREGYIATHYAMWREQEKWPKTATGLPSTAGTTASVAFFRRGKLYIGHVGDSGIILGYQEEGDKFWRARQLTYDHKPECTVEKNRIINAGGKVVTKSGVARVVWNRPRIGHKGPVRRSTPIDEIPFLAVARSLGDLWSYNSSLNQFVVSPDPDVKVIRIDPKTFRCLIFGTDGLWNVVSANDAVEVARDTEMINDKIFFSGSTDWTSPSKCLVDKALEKWGMKKMRADNTTVVTIMLDPPGPPKKEILKNYCSMASINLQYAPTEYSNVGLNNLLRGERNSCGSPYINIDDNDNSESLFDPSTSTSAAATDASSVNNSLTMPTNGYAVMTRYESNCDSNISLYNNHSDDLLSNANTSTCELINSTTVSASNTSSDANYMSSFAESYNSLLVSSFENGNGEHSSRLENGMLIDSNVVHNNHLQEQSSPQQEQHHQQQIEQQHQYQQHCMSTEEGYSLTKLETRGEQQINSMRNYQNSNTIPFQAFIDENSSFQYDNISSTYQQAIISDNSNSNYNHPQHSRHTIVQIPKEINVQFFDQQNLISSIQYQPIRRASNVSIISNTSPIVHNASLANISNTSLATDEIQINEISSSSGTCIIISDDDDEEEEEEENYNEEHSDEEEDDEDGDDDDGLDDEDDEDEEDGDEDCDEEEINHGNEKNGIINTNKNREVIQQIESGVPRRRNIGQEQLETINNRSNIYNNSNNMKLSTVDHKKLYSIEQNENISAVEPRRLRSSAIFANNMNTKRTLRSRNLQSKDNNINYHNSNTSSSNSNKQHVHAPIILNHQLSKLRATCLRSRQIDEDLNIWQPPQKRMKTVESGTSSRSGSSSNAHYKSNTNNGSGNSTANILNGQITSLLASSYPRSRTNSRITRNNANNNSWCIEKRSTMQTRHRNQKRLSHY